MAATSAPPQNESRLIAPVWHTLAILIFLLFVSVAGQRWLAPVLKGSSSARLVTYSFTLAMEWFLVWLVWLGVRTRAIRLAELIGGSWPTVKSVLRDLGIAVAFLIASNIVLALISYAVKSQPTEAVRRIIPHGFAEIGVWILLSFTAGICEELIFRGYLQRQFAAMTSSVAAGIVIQGILFGAAHGYQGWKSMLVIAVYGCLFGLLANWVRNLRPGMMAHFLQDSVNGIIAGRFLK